MKPFSGRIKRWREKREGKRYARMMVALTLSPGTLEQLKQRLEEDDWTGRREGR